MRMNLPATYAALKYKIRTSTNLVPRVFKPPRRFEDPGYEVASAHGLMKNFDQS